MFNFFSRKKQTALGLCSLPLSGNYSGWARSLGNEWEDLIGVVKVECKSTEDQSIVTIKTLEFGSWQGTLSKNENSFRANTGQGNSYFMCSIRSESQSHQNRTVLEGAIWETPANKLVDIKLLGEWQSSIN